MRKGAGCASAVLPSVIPSVVTSARLPPPQGRSGESWSSLRPVCIPGRGISVAGAQLSTYRFELRAFSETFRKKKWVSFYRQNDPAQLTDSYPFFVFTARFIESYAAPTFWGAQIVLIGAELLLLIVMQKQAVYLTRFRKNRH